MNWNHRFSSLCSQQWYYKNQQTRVYMGQITPHGHCSPIDQPDIEIWPDGSRWHKPDMLTFSLYALLPLALMFIYIVLMAGK